MSNLIIDNITVAFKNFSLSNISITLPPGKVLVVLGPSGSGKSVLLETIAGFYRPQQGSIYLDGSEITGLPPEKRGIGFVFQDYALFPNKSVLKNISFPLQFRRDESRPEDGITVEQAMNMLQLNRLSGRYPGTLSGGEKQRVALARALVCRPKLFLFDEPMSALDARARESLQEDLRSIIRELGLTAVYVTHDQAEALALGDIVAVINEGKLLQCDTGMGVFNRPLNMFVARFVGMENLLAGQVARTMGNMAEVKLEGGSSIRVWSNENVPAGKKVLAGIRPENIIVCPALPEKADYGENNFLTVKVCDLFPTGVFFKMRTGGPQSLVAYLARREVQALGLERGKTVCLCIPARDIHLIFQ